MIVTVDPGLSSGVTTCSANWDVRTFEWDWQATCAFLMTLPDGPEVEILWESFFITMQTVKLSQEDMHWPLEIIGMCRLIAWNKGWRVLPPASPGDRKLGKKEFLVKLGWLPRGMKDDDGLSSAMHLLAYLLRTGRLPRELQDKLFT